MTFFSMSQRQVPTKYELQWSIVAIVRPMQLFPPEKLGFDMLTAGGKFSGICTPFEGKTDHFGGLNRFKMKENDTREWQKV